MGIKKFQTLVLRAQKPDLLSLTTGGPGTEAFQAALKNHLFDLPGPRYAGLSLTERGKFINKVFRGYAEIATSLETLGDLKFLVGRFPFPSSRISGDRYLQICVEAFLAEIYILKVRLERYLKLLQKEFKGDVREQEVRTRALALAEIVNKAFRQATDIRSAHTHEERFKDEGISRLRTISLIARGEDDEFARLMKGYYRAEHITQKRRWERVIAANIKSIRQLLAVFFEGLLPVLFDQKTGELRFPQRMRERL